MIKQQVRVVALSLGLLSSPLWGQTFESLYSFPTSRENGVKPQTALTLASDGNFYGVTSDGGANDLNGGGTLFKYSITEGFSVVHHFDPATTGEMYISRPTGQLLNIGDGYLYGTTFNGGTPPSGAGTVYRFDPTTGNITVLYAISSAGNTTPQNAVALVSGEPNVLHALCYDYSGIWRIPLDGSERTVQFFTSDGRKPTSIIRGSDGFLYGVTESGGTNGIGSIFRTNSDGTGWTVLHDCDGETGYNPTGPMLEVNGYFYGVMGYGGPSDVKSVNGVLYRMSPAGEYTMLRVFNDFDVPSGNLVLATDGMLYGVARQVGPGGNGNGGIYRIKTNGSGYKVLHVFATNKNGIDYPTGRAPIGGLVQGPDGYLYGTTDAGPGNSGGGIFRLKLDLPPPPINQPPVAVDDLVVSGGEVTVNVTENDLNLEGDVLTVTIEGDPEFGTAVVQEGGAIHYTPDAGEFEGDTFYYKVTDAVGGSSIGRVIIQTTPAGPLVVPGSYNGLVADPNGATPLPRGQFVLNVMADNKFTGTLFAQKKRVALRGKFDESGKALLDVKIPGQGKGQIFLGFQRGLPNTIRAGVLGTEFWMGDAGPTTTSDFQSNKSYTVQIRSNNPSVLPTTLPAGYGYGTVTVKPSGAVRMIGKLGDGTNLKWSSSLTRLPGISKSIPFFAEPLKGGVFSGFANESESVIGGFEGDARWVRPPGKASKPYEFGFIGNAEVRISPFTPPTGTAPVMDLPAGDVALIDLPNGLPSTSGTFSIDGKKIISSGNLRSLTINRKNGLVSGTMRVGNETLGFKTLSFKGAIDQPGRFGFGQVSVKGVTGAMELFNPIP